MNEKWTDRTIRGPAEDYMTAEEFGKLFGGVTGDTVRNWVKAGTLPAPVKLSAQTLLFTWEHAVYYALAAKFGLLAGDPAEAVKGKPRKEATETGG